MSNKTLIYILNTALLSAVCLTTAVADTTKPADIEALTQSIASGVLVKLNMSDPARPELQTMSLEKIVTEALHAGKSLDEVRQAVSLMMEELTGKPLNHVAADIIEPPSETDSVVSASEERTSEERTIPLTTVLLPNESLSSVAKRIYGPENGRRYLDIYELNKDVIPNINVIPEGTVLKLPE